MKILHVGKYFFPFSGGLENYMRDAMVALSRRGFEAAALVHQHSLSLRTIDETVNASEHSFNIVRTGMWARFLFTPISPAFPWHLRRMIKTFKPDVLHLHLPNPSVFWVLALPSAWRIPWVVHWHSDVITSAQDWRMKLFYKLYQPFESQVLRHARYIVATSEPYLNASHPLKRWRTKCRVVPLGVDTERFGKTPVGGALWEARCGRRALAAIPSSQNQNSSIPTRTDRGGEKVRPETGREAGLGHAPPTSTTTNPPLQVLAVGRLTYYKGFRYLIEAAAKTPAIHVHLVGDGDQEEQLKILAASLNLQDRVTFHGVLSDAELALQMADCDCLCLPSIERTEAFGMVLLESMYFGKANVISDVEGSGMGWIVDDGITGLKVNPADADALSGAFQRLAANREELQTMGRRGKEKFDQQFEINHAVEGLAEIYQQTTHTNPIENDK